MTSWMRRAFGLTAAVALTACGSAIDKPGQVAPSEGFVACGDECSGGGGGGAPATAVRLAAFEDSGSSGEYYEIRQTFYNAAGTPVSYNPQKWDGDAMALGTFVPQIVASGMPCGGHLEVSIGTIGFFNSWTPAIANPLVIRAPGTYSFFNYADPYNMGLISYSWNGCN